MTLSGNLNFHPQLSVMRQHPPLPVSLVQCQSSPPKTVGLSTESHNLNDMIENPSL